MIRKISTIRNLAVFKNFEWDKSVLDTHGRPMVFEKINVLYGRNYSGKTTLSRIVRGLETGDISNKYDNPTFLVSFDDGTTINQSQLSNCRKPFRVFNEDFVRDNLGFISNPDEAIKSFAVLGDNNNILETEIAALNSELGSNEVGKESGLYAKLNADRKVYREITTAYEQVATGLDKQLTTKATDRKVGIKYNLDMFGDPNYNITKLSADIEEVLSDSYVSLDDQKKLDYMQLLSERIKPTISALPPLSAQQWEQICNEAEYILSKEIGTSGKIVELLRDAALNEWVKRGCEFHKGVRTHCAFCGSTISDERWIDLYKHFDDESKELEDKIDALLKRIENEKESVENGFTVDQSRFYSKFQEKVEQLMQSYSEVALRYAKQLDLIAEQLSNRQKDITTHISFARPVDYTQEIFKIRTSYEELRNESNEFSGKLNKEQTKAKRELLLQEVYEFCETVNYIGVQEHINNKKGELEAAKERIDTREAEINAIIDQIQNKRRQLNDEEKGALRVNKYLTDFFGHEFLSLQAIEDGDEGQKQVRFEIVRDGKRAYHLSEGECSLIAFCYFIAKLDDIETTGTKPIIWIDDPISSLDGNHIFFVYSLIVAEIAKKGLFEQLFVSTHNLDFLKYLRRLNSYELQPNGELKLQNGKPKSLAKQYFIVNRQYHSSTIQPMPKYLKEYGTEFNYLFSCIYKCSLVSEADDTNYELFYNFGNNARKFLEIYLYFKYPDYSDDKLERFFGEESVPTILLERINNEYSHLNGTVERASMPVVVPEMTSTAKLIIAKIKEDGEQYAALLSSIGILE